jgi:NAD-dependent dihydropyrimidine dehydrogenase PreA subunit
MTYVILSACVDIKDGACVDVCPVDCIYEGENMFYIHPVECVACGLCESICPVDAIRPIDEIPEHEKNYIKINRDYFDLKN